METSYINTARIVVAWYICHIETVATTIKFFFLYTDNKDEGSSWAKLVWAISFQLYIPRGEGIVSDFPSILVYLKGKPPRSKPQECLLIVSL